jgi:hypothetical protein
VRLYEGQAERLDEALHSRAKSKRVRRVGEVRPSAGGWSVTLDGATIGTLESGPYNPYNRLCEAQAAGFPLTCWVQIVRELGKPLRVNAGLPPD